MHQETKHTCNLAVKHGDLGIYVDKIESQDFGIKLFSAWERRSRSTAPRWARSCWPIPRPGK